MKKILLLLGLMVSLFPVSRAVDTKNSEINWMTFEQMEAKMKEKPKKVLIDVYTSWCGWCKVMDKKTYSNDSLIRFVNEHYYAVKFDAEQKTAVNFMGKKWDYSSQNRINELAVQLLQGKLSYPTTVFMDENFENPQPMPGYLELFQMESILKYLGGNHHKSTPWQDWQRSFKPGWPTVNVGK